MPQLARDYLYRFVRPVAKRQGLFVNEYPWLEQIYETKTHSDCPVYLKRNKGLRRRVFFISFFDFSVVFSEGVVSSGF